MEEVAALGPFSKVAYGMAMASLGFFSVVGYTTYLRAIWGNKELQKRSIFLMSLCVSDLVLISGHMVFTVMATFYKDWPFGEIGCQLNAFFGMGPSLVSISNIMLIAYDTYYRECKKEKYLVNYGYYIAVAWILGLFAGLLPMIGLGSYGFESELRVGCLLDFTDKYSGLGTYIALLTSFWFVYPIMSMIRCYWKLQKETGDGFLLKVVPTQMLCAWTPYAITSIFTVMLGPANVPRVPLAMIANLCAKICIATNPYIYVLNDVRLRVACCEVLFGAPKKGSKKMATLPEEKEKST